MRKYFATSLITLTLVALPTAAFASKPTHPVTPSHETTSAAPATHPTAPTVMYVLHGTLSTYTGATSSTPGTVTITVTASNFEPKILKGMALVFATNSKTTIVLHNHKAIANGDHGIVKVRAPKNSTATVLQTKTAFQVIDQGATK